MGLKSILVFIFMAIIVLVLPCVMLPSWFNSGNAMKKQLYLTTNQTRSLMLDQVENTVKLLGRFRSSATSVANSIKFLKLRRINLSQTDLRCEVTKLMFEAFSILPHIAQISYVDLEAPYNFFSYYKQDNNSYALYCNSSSSNLNDSNPYQPCYKQNVDFETGDLFGDRMSYQSLILANERWIQRASSEGYASLETGWDLYRSKLFMNSFDVDGAVVVALGFSVNEVVEYFSKMNFYGGSLFLKTEDGEEIMDGTSIRMMVDDGFIHSKFMDYRFSGSVFVACNTSQVTWNTRIEGIDNDVYCSPINIIGVPLVYALAFPDRATRAIPWNSKTALILLAVTVTVLILFFLSFVFFMVWVGLREMQLCSSLIKQMEATQQAERKSMNKSVAFANASHDIRAALAGISSLIDLCYQEASPGSELETNLRQMGDCTKDLVGLLNSILDTSKIEAGKMQLDEEEFDLERLLEDVVDLYHPMGMKKGIEVVLDSYDGSVLKFSQVKGDRMKLKQILCNLLSNAVKFTFEGHVLIQAWVQKPSFENKIIASNQNKKRIFQFFHGEKADDMEAVVVQQGVNRMEFVFDVSDTGQGIPKEKQKSVFENYVQIKETTFDQGGTGLGLGIVQSLVRLMGGEIGIIDKEDGERGTCFRFNVFLTALDTSSTGAATGLDLPASRYPGPSVAMATSSLVCCTSSPRCGTRSPMSPRSPKIEASQVVLLIHNEERLRASKKFMEGLGIKVSVVTNWESLYQVLMRVKSRLAISPPGSSRKSDIGLRSDDSDLLRKYLPLSSTDGMEHTRLSSRVRGSPEFVLLVIDTTAGPFQELSRAVTEFKEGLNPSLYKVVWLDKPASRNKDLIIDPNDLTLCKPFHGSRLFQVIKLLPEFAEPLRSATASNSFTFRTEPSTFPTQEPIKIGAAQSEIQEEHVHSDQPLKGLKILVADDTEFIRKITQSVLSKLGATVHVCENGQEAVDLVRAGFKDQEQHLSFTGKPYDYILMDCKMPEMDGYEATRLIRIEEACYGVRIPILAATALDSGEVPKIYEAGMDYYFGKGINKEKILKAIREVNRVVM